MTLLIAHIAWNRITVVCDQLVRSPTLGDASTSKVRILPHLGAMVFSSGLDPCRELLAGASWQIPDGDCHDLAAIAPDVLAGWWATETARRPDLFASPTWTTRESGPSTTVYVAGQAVDGEMCWWRFSEPDFAAVRHEPGDLVSPTPAAWPPDTVQGRYDDPTAMIDVALQVQAERPDIIGRALWAYNLTDGPCFEVFRVCVLDETVRRPRMTAPVEPFSDTARRIAANFSPGRPGLNLVESGGDADGRQVHTSPSLDALT